MTRMLLTGAVCALVAVGAPLPTKAAEPIRLITVDEARLPPVGVVAGPERNLTRGPGIDRLAPSAIGVEGPFRFAVKFKPRNGVAVDPGSVRVTYQRQPSVDLTPRVKAFVTADGIDAPSVIVPPGKHVIEIEATDREGRIGRSQVLLTVDVQK